MRHLKWIMTVIVVGLAITEIILNVEVLGQELLFRLALPGAPLGFLVLPLWTALLLLFIAGFAFAILLEMGAWYQYTRTIRLQRQQIKALQAEQEKPKPAGTAN